MEWKFRKSILYEAILCSFALMAFSFFIHYRFPVRLISFASLIVASYIIGRNIKSLTDFKKYTGEISLSRIPVIFIMAGISSGILLSVLYRYHLDLSFFPGSFHRFVIIAGIIGIAEELVFRGFIQGFIKQLDIPASVLFGTLSHTGYKCCLFLSPAITSGIDIGYLAFWTFTAGIMLGILRQISNSIIPSLTAHALFDILAYAEFTSAPWWVW
jgi:membrane protease YdiL (CAAX protease family)